MPDKIVDTKGWQQVGALTSFEQGTLVTVAVAGNAQGGYIPPFFVFPRERLQEHFLWGGPVGCTGAANGSGWMQEGDFMLFLLHFVRHTGVNPSSKLLLLLDNHLSTGALNFCQENGIVVLSFPPHCPHSLQPMDRSVFGPFKGYMNSATDLWMRSHPGGSLSIYDVPSLVAEALPKAAKPSNLMSGFSDTGIWPFNPAVFREYDFAPCLLTDRPPPHDQALKNTSATPGRRQTNNK